MIPIEIRPRPGRGAKTAALAIPVFLLLFASGCSRNSERFRFVFMTDIHLESTATAVTGFEAAISAVNALHPDFVVTGGDLVADALEQKKARADSLYDLYIEKCGLFQMPVYNTIGNHEHFGVYSQSGISPGDPDFGKGMFRRRLGGGTTYRSFDWGTWHFILLDGVGVTDDRNYIGRVDSAEVRWLAGDLARLDPARNLALVTHIPLLTVSTQFREGVLKPNNPWLVVSNGDTVLHLLQSHRLRLVLQGHLHLVEKIRWRDTLIITAGAVSGAWWNGPFEGFDPGFAVFDVNGDRISWWFKKLQTPVVALP
jgi:3',5'-cyclic AMP phosphodiesterase CpdA